jgi:hypothetical protein
VNSNKLVQPEKLQSQAQPIIDAFDDSPDAEAKYLEQQKYEAAKAAAVATEQVSILVRAAMKTAVKEIAAALPAYVVPSDSVLAAKMQAEIDAKKPTDQK